MTFVFVSLTSQGTFVWPDHSFPLLKLCFAFVLFFTSSPAHAQVRYHLRFSFTPRAAPMKEKSELSPNSDLDWHMFSLFPLFQLPGPREQPYKEGGTPGKHPLSIFNSSCGCLSFSILSALKKPHII